MAIGVQVWSQTASANSTADTNINWAEGQAPSSVNDSARAEMASVAKWRDDNNGTLATSGTTTAYTVTTNQVAAALTDGYTVAIKFHATNDSSATLNQDGLGAKNLQLVAGTNVSGGEFLSGSIHRLKYDSGSTAWIAQGASLIGSSAVNSFQIADTAVTYQKLQTPGASKLLGNPSTSTSTNYREITLGTNLSFSGTTLNAGNNTPVVTVITSTATATWQSTTQNGNFPLYLLVRMAGGGGGGGAANTNNGSSGTDTSFNNWTAIGGGKGLNGANAGGAGGTGGVNGTGTVIRRLNGQTGLTSVGSDVGWGGGTFLWSAGNMTSNLNIGATQSGQTQIANTGCGGCGGGNGSVAGSGGGGAEYVEFIVTSPSTAYTVQVGPGGAGGSSGGQAGTAGAAGRIEVIAYWQ